MWRRPTIDAPWLFTVVVCAFFVILGISVWHDKGIRRAREDVRSIDELQQLRRDPKTAFLHREASKMRAKILARYDGNEAALRMRAQRTMVADVLAAIFGRQLGLKELLCVVFVLLFVLPMAMAVQGARRNKRRKGIDG